MDGKPPLNSELAAPVPPISEWQGDNEGDNNEDENKGRRARGKIHGAPCSRGIGKGSS
jgi:hypothetical protein